MSKEKISLIPSMADAINAESDIFGRDTFRDGIINLFRNSGDPLVVALDEPWGSGKTVFAKRLQNKIDESDELNAIYFDAFENDHEDDVFIALASKLLSALDITKEDKNKWNKAKEVAKVFSRVAMKAGLRMLTAGVVKSADLEKSNKEVATEISDIAEAELDQLIDLKLEKFDKDRLVFSAFRAMLEEKARDKPIVFIVDELDRCKPKYALSLLETIKHLFSVPSVHFFLVSNSSSMVASIEHEYGKINGFEYLHKFISLRMGFPVPYEQERQRQISSFIKIHLPESDDISRAAPFFLEDSFLNRDYSLREIEKLCFLTKLSINFSNDKDINHSLIYIVLIDMKLKNPLLYKNAKLGKITYEQVAKFYNWNSMPTPAFSGLARIESIWFYILERPLEEDWNRFKGMFWGVDTDGNDVIAGAIQYVIDALPSD